MIRQRAKEGLKLRVKMGVLVGRPIGRTSDNFEIDNKKDAIIEQYKWGVPLRRIASNFNVDRNTLDRALGRWGVVQTKAYIKAASVARKQLNQLYKENNYKIVKLDRNKCRDLIELDFTIPQIANEFPEYTYEQVYDTILCDEEFNPLYRKHGQLKVKK